MMDLLSNKWLSEMEMDDSDFIHEWQHMSSLENSVDSFTCKIFPSNNNMTNPSSTLRSAPQVSQISVDQQIEQVEQKHWKLCTSEKASSPSSTIISFANSDTPRASAYDNYGNAKFYVNSEVEPVEIVSLQNINSSSVYQISLENPYGPLGIFDGVRRGPTRNRAQAQDHVLSERKRRERMTQRFTALSTVIQGPKRSDKATILGDAIKYIKELQERARKLEEEVKRNDEESIVSVKRPRLSGYVDCSSSDENFDSSSDKPLPEIEVRASEGNLLVRVYCNNQTGIIKEILSEIERHHLTMVSSSVMPFGDNRLHLTIIAQMADQYKMTGKTLVAILRMAIVNLI